MWTSYFHFRIRQWISGLFSVETYSTSFSLLRWVCTVLSYHSIKKCSWKYGWVCLRLTKLDFTRRKGNWLKCDISQRRAYNETVPSVERRRHLTLKYPNSYTRTILALPYPRKPSIKCLCCRCFYCGLIFCHWKFIFRFYYHKGKFYSTWEHFALRFVTVKNIPMKKI